MFKSHSALLHLMTLLLVSPLHLSHIVPSSYPAKIEHHCMYLYTSGLGHSSISVQIKGALLYLCNYIVICIIFLAGNDYNTTEVTFTLSGGGNEMFEVNINIIDDNIQEVPNIENFTAVLSAVSSNVPFTLDPDTALVTIMDDDGM